MHFRIEIPKWNGYSVRRVPTKSQAQPTRAERLRAELREDVVRAAAAVFAGRGYHRTAMADIAAAVGVGQSTIYAQFPGKRALLDAVIIDVMRRVASLLVAENAPAAADDFDAYRDQARRIAHGFADVTRADTGIVRLLRLLLLEAETVDEALAERAAQFLDESARMTAAYLRHGQRRGYLRTELDVMATARVVNGLILSVAFDQTRPEATERTTRRAVDAALELYFAGVRAV